MLLLLLVLLLLIDHVSIAVTVLGSVSARSVVISHVHVHCVHVVHGSEIGATVHHATTSLHLNGRAIRILVASTTTALHVLHGLVLLLALLLLLLRSGSETRSHAHVTTLERERNIYAFYSINIFMG